MDNRKYCPECQQSMPKNKDYCSCGWKFAKRESQPVADYQCHYRDLGIRCEKAGTLSHARTGKNWYCSSHYHVLRNDSMQKVSFMNRFQQTK